MNTSEETDRLAAFNAYRDRLHQQILNEKDHLGTKRFFNREEAVYREGALDRPTKELLRLVASMVLRCNDCIDYPLQQCVELGVSDDELDDAMNVALVVGGSIVIPHLRRGRDHEFAARAGRESGPRGRR